MKLTHYQTVRYPACHQKVRKRISPPFWESVDPALGDGGKSLIAITALQRIYRIYLKGLMAVRALRRGTLPYLGCRAVPGAAQAHEDIQTGETLYIDRMR